MKVIGSLVVAAAFLGAPAAAGAHPYLHLSGAQREAQNALDAWQQRYPGLGLFASWIDDCHREVHHPRVVLCRWYSVDLASGGVSSDLLAVFWRRDRVIVRDFTLALRFAERPAIWDWASIRPGRRAPGRPLRPTASGSSR